MVAGACYANYMQITIEPFPLVVEELPTLDVCVLSSISEAQPLVILEAGAVGVPIVATDVGSCSELLLGRTLEDKALGPGGLLTPIASPGETAKAILRMVNDPALRKEFGRNLRQRVHTFFDEVDMIRSYDELYRGHLPQPPKEQLTLAEVE